MSDLDYLAGGIGRLIEGGTLKAGTDASATAIGEAWVAAHVDLALVELLAELLAHWAAELGEEQASAAQVQQATEFLGLQPSVRALLSAAVVRPVGALELAALAVHLVDIAEGMAFYTFIPELPALYAKSDRTGGAARNVGVARHLRG